MIRQRTTTDRRILVCAFACHPKGESGLGAGEDVLGWNMVQQIARFNEVHVMTHACNREAIERAPASADGRRVRFHYVRLPRGPERLRRNHKGPIQLYAYLWQLKAYGVARRLHREHRFDAFHHVTFANDWMASYVGALLPVPYIRGPGGGAQQTPEGLRRELPMRDAIWEWVRNAGQRLLRHDPFFLLGRKRARALLLCNNESLGALPASAASKAQLFPVNGCTAEDLDLLGRRTSGPGDDRFRVLSVGSLLKVKRFDLGIRGFARFAERHPNSQLLIVGEGPERPHLERLVDKLGLQGQVVLDGWRSRAEVFDRISASDVFLFPSARDGGAAAVVEAMGASLPVICLDVGGPGMHVQPDCGIRLTPGSEPQVVEDIARELGRLHGNVELRQALGRNARQRVKGAYHWGRLGERLQDLYDAVLEPNGA
jgi:glycosyltransferase involved in cell wall biosynthesis